MLLFLPHNNCSTHRETTEISKVGNYLPSMGRNLGILKKLLILAIELLYFMKKKIQNKLHHHDMVETWLCMFSKGKFMSVSLLLASLCLLYRYLMWIIILSNILTKQFILNVLFFWNYIIHQQKIKKKRGKGSVKKKKEKKKNTNRFCYKWTN